MIDEIATELSTGFVVFSLFLYFLGMFVGWIANSQHTATYGCGRCCNQCRAVSHRHE